MTQPLIQMWKRTPFYGMFHALVQIRATRKFWKWLPEDEARFEFYRQFISPGDIVFDVGANLGNRAKVFWKLGAVVVAVEPQPGCGAYLRTVFKGRQRFYLEEKALGSRVGQAEMFMSNLHVISSLSADWVKSVQASGRFKNAEWCHKQLVALDTVDNLVSAYGAPDFIKIDVEGFESEVLAGLTQPAKVLSMEFTPECMSDTYRCIDRLCSLGNVEFQYALGESMSLTLPHWVSADEIRAALGNVPQSSFGDLYARFRASADMRPADRSAQ